MKLEINSIHYKVDKKLHDYVIKKIEKLERYMPRHARESAHIEVFLKEAKIKEKKECTCEVVIHLPKETLTTKETTRNMFAAVDIVEAKLKNLLRKYKDLHHGGKLHRRLFAKLKRTT